MLIDIGAHLFAAAAQGRLTYKEGRPIRRASRIPPDVLTSALGAVSDLALALSPEEAAAANAAACRAVLPLLRGADASKVAAVKEGIEALHAAAVTGQPAPDGVQQQVEAALRDLSSSAGKRKAPAGNSTSSKQQRGHATGGRQQQQGPSQEAATEQQQEPAGGSSSKRQRVASLEDAERQPMIIEELPYQVCGISEGSDMLVSDDWCGSGARHLGCLGSAEVPEGVWCCSSMCAEHIGEAEAAAYLHGRWVLGKFQGVE
jgi:hypothetical protein